METRIEFSMPDEPKPFGVIEFGSSWSGTIWLYDECIGEFEHIQNIYTVVPISNYRKRPEEAVKIDPITYFFGKWK